MISGAGAKVYLLQVRILQSRPSVPLVGSKSLTRTRNKYINFRRTMRVVRYDTTGALTLWVGQEGNRRSPTEVAETTAYIYIMKERERTSNEYFQYSRIGVLSMVVIRCLAIEKIWPSN